MINDFILSFKIKNTYRANSVIYSLKKLPLINKLLPNTLYSNSGLKTLANIIGLFLELLSIFVGKFLYILVMIVFASSMYQPNSDSFFLHAFILLTIAGGILNSDIFNPSKDKYYAICLMKFNAKRYFLCNYYYFLLKILVGFLPFTILFGLVFHVKLSICLMLPVFVICVKLIIGAWGVRSSTRKKKITNENLPTISALIIIAILLALTYGLPIVGFYINVVLFYILFIISFLISIPSFFYLKRYNQYSKIYKELLTPDTVLLNRNVKASEMNKKAYLNQINTDMVMEDGKTGYEFFHHIFVKRHRKMLWKATKTISLIFLIGFSCAIVAAIFVDGFKEGIQKLLDGTLPYFLFVMYIINRGEKITAMIFTNCDRSMLTYRFYRQPSAILKLFQERLKTLIQLNIVPGTIIAVGIVLLLYVSGGTSVLNYVLTFLAIISMSIFFSIHYLVLYYLLQPYTIDIEMKDPRFAIINWITYFICYFAIQIRIPTVIFGSCMILFTVVYSVVALFLAYRYAAKTFKLRN